MRDYVAEAGKVYKYYLQWLTTIEHFKAKIDSIEFELNSKGKSFDIFNDADGKQIKKINYLQSELIFYQRQKEDVLIFFLKVKEIVEARIESLFGLLIEDEKYVRNPTVPDSLSEAIDEIIKNDSLSLNLHLVVNSWKTFFLELKEKYKRFFQKHK